MHAFAPVVLFVLGLIALGTGLPDTPRHRFIHLVEDTEKKVPVGAIILISLLIYWLLRFALDGWESITLITH